MIYYLYHIPGKKIGVTRDLKERVERQQGYNSNEYKIIGQSEDINFISDMEIYLQKFHDYRVDTCFYLFYLLVWNLFVVGQVKA